MKDYKKILFVVAHPDDAEICAGGTILKLCNKGYNVKVVMMTNGNLGINNKSKYITKKIRLKEEKLAAKYAGFSYKILNNSDGILKANISNRKKIINIIKEFQPDIIVTHRKNDYHVDHRVTSQIVEDSLVLICSKNICKKHNYLSYNPIILYFWDRFTKPYKFVCDIVVDITAFYEKKLNLMYYHKSQFTSMEACQNILDENNELQKKYCTNNDFNYVELFEIGEYSLINEIDNFKKSIESVFGD